MGHSIGAFMAVHAVHRLEHPSGDRESHQVARAVDEVAAEEERHPQAWETKEALQEELSAALRHQRDHDRDSTATQAGSAASTSGREEKSNVRMVVSLFPFFTGVCVWGGGAGAESACRCGGWGGGWLCCQYPGKQSSHGDWVCCWLQWIQTLPSSARCGA